MFHRGCSEVIIEMDLGISCVLVSIRLENEHTKCTDSSAFVISERNARLNNVPGLVLVAGQLVQLSLVLHL